MSLKMLTGCFLNELLYKNQVPYKFVYRMFQVFHTWCVFHCNLRPELSVNTLGHVIHLLNNPTDTKKHIRSSIQVTLFNVLLEKLRAISVPDKASYCNITLKSQSPDICVISCVIVLKLDSRLGSIAAEAPVKDESDTIILAPILWPRNLRIFLQSFWNFTGILAALLSFLLFDFEDNDCGTSPNHAIWLLIG